MIIHNRLMIRVLLVVLKILVLFYLIVHWNTRKVKVKHHLNLVVNLILRMLIEINQHCRTMFSFIYSRMLQLEEESIRAMCQDVIAVKPDVVVTEKGISGKVNKNKEQSAVTECALDVAAHYLAAAGISAVRRTKKSDNNRISRASGASIVNDTADLKEEDVGTGCGLFEIRKIGDE